jgi:hypothetical protein
MTNPLQPQYKVISYALGTYKVFIESVGVETLILFEIEYAIAFFNSRKHSEEESSPPMPIISPNN